MFCVVQRTLLVLVWMTMASVLASALCPAGSVLCDTGTWPMAGRDDSRTGQSSFYGPISAVSARWTFTTPTVEVGPGVLGINDILSAASGPHLYAINVVSSATSAAPIVLWNYTFGASRINSIVTSTVV